MKNMIKICGARAGGLNNVDMDLPLGELICFTGRSSNGRRAMALQVLYAESRRRYMHALSPGEREGVGGVGQVDMDEISGLPPAIYLGLARRGRTVGDYLQLDGLLIQLALENGQMHCSSCGGVCHGYEAAAVEHAAAKSFSGRRCLVLAPLTLQQETDWQSLWGELRLAGFLRVMVGDEVVRLDGDMPAIPEGEDRIFVVVDRLIPAAESSVRFLEAVRLSRSISSGQTLVLDVEADKGMHYNQQPTCEDCGQQYEELVDADFTPGRSQSHLISLDGRMLSELEQGPIGALQQFLLEYKNENHLRLNIVSILAEACALGLQDLQLNRRLERVAAGEWQRLQLVACLSSGLMGILYIFDGIGTQIQRDLLPSIIACLRRLVGLGNTVLLLDHSSEIVGRADQVWEFVEGEPRKIELAPEVHRPDAHPRSCANKEKLAIRGTGAIGCLDIELPHGALTCLHGPSGCGKTRLLREVLPAVLKGQAAGYEVSGVGRNKRVVTINNSTKHSTVLAELGLFERIAGLYAASAMAKAQGWGRAAFMLDKPGGRCPSCEGLGYRYFALEFLEDISLVCEVCEGLRFRSEIREITLRGVSISDVLAMTLQRAYTHFTRDLKMHNKLEAAIGCGLGYITLGQNVQRLEAGEWLRLRLACLSTRKSHRDWVLIDDPAGGDHPDDVLQMAAALRGLVNMGATVVVAERHPLILAEADCLVDLTR